MPTEPAATAFTAPSLAALRATAARRQEAARWLRALPPILIAIVAWTACTTVPRPGLAGRHLAVAVTLGVFLVSGAGAVLTQNRPGHLLGPKPLHLAFVGLLLASSTALVWLQPDAAGEAGIFVGMALLAPALRAHRSVPVTLALLLALATVVGVSHRSSITDALLNAIMIGAFYGLLFLAMRLGEANVLAERLVGELERSREAEARAAGLAERQRLAREMHDVLAHALSGLLLQLEGARMLAAGDPADPRLPEAINRAHQLGKAGLEEARRAIGTLRDDALPGPERLAELAEQFARDVAVPCRLTVSGEAHELGSEARVALYRVAQEALTNVAKHARPERVELCLAYEPSTARLTVEDFGVPNPAGGDGGGYGLTGMRERAELLGGTLTAGPTATGFRVELAVPA